MILINTIDSDITTQNVVDWLIYYKVTFCIINENSFLELDKITKNEIIISVNGKKINLNQETAYWYRRGTIQFNKDLIENSITIFENGNLIQGYLKKELSKIHDIINNFPFKNRIGNFNDNSLNKINMLKNAVDVGLEIPEFIITSRKDELIEFKKINEKIVTKLFQIYKYLKLRVVISWFIQVL